MTTAPDAAGAERIAAAVAAHPAVAHLHGGPYNDIATYLPGHRLVGVRVGAQGDPVEVAVVLRTDRLEQSIPGVVADLRRAVRDVCGAGTVDITVADIMGPDEIDVPTDLGRDDR